mgnify:CR=1 FL=1
MQITKGSWQESVWEHLVKYGSISNPLASLKGNARSYTPRYRESLANMLIRAEKAGYKIGFEYGPRGGEWGGTYFLTAMPIEHKKYIN